MCSAQVRVGLPVIHKYGLESLFYEYGKRCLVGCYVCVWVCVGVCVGVHFNHHVCVLVTGNVMA